MHIRFVAPNGKVLDDVIKFTVDSLGDLLTITLDRMNDQLQIVRETYHIAPHSSNWMVYLQ
jgi:hypothetical protein